MQSVVARREHQKHEAVTRPLDPLEDRCELRLAFGSGKVNRDRPVGVGLGVGRDQRRGQIIPGCDQRLPLGEEALRRWRTLDHQNVVELGAQPGRRPVRATRQHLERIPRRRATLDQELVVDAGTRRTGVREIAMVDLEVGASKIVGHIGTRRAAVADQNVPSRAEYFQGFDQLLIVDLVERRVDLAPAAIGVGQELQDGVPGIPREITSTRKARLGQLGFEPFEGRHGDFADHPAHHLRHDRSAIEAGGEPVSELTRNDDRFRPRCRPIGDCGEATVALVDHRGHAIADLVCVTDAVVGPNAASNRR